MRKAEAWAQEELGTHLRLRQALVAHEESLVGTDSELIESTLEAVRAAGCDDLPRSRRRAEWLRGLGQAWQVEPSTLTLRSVAERAGDGGARLDDLRAELDSVARQVVDSARRVSLLARQQRAVVGEILSVFTGVDPTSENDTRGTLIHVEA